MSMARDEYWLELDLGDGEGFRPVRGKVLLPKAVAEEARREILAVASRIGVRWEVRIRRPDQ